MALIYGHRGASAYAPENTLEAFKLAMEMGADGVELDVHLSRDGELMVIHDIDLDRTTGFHGKVCDYTLKELKELDAYAREKGMELIPCIQTLAHLRSIFRWPVYDDIHDCHDILLLEEEKTYQLIDDMLRTCSECFESRTVNVGMDEAMFMGLGKYLKKHGKIVRRLMIDTTELASTAIRELVEQGKPYAHLVPAGVADYIEKRGLYKKESADA